MINKYIAISMILLMDFALFGQNQTIFNVDVTSSICSGETGSIKLTIIDNTFPLPYTIEIEEADDTPPKFYDITSSQFTISNLAAKEYLLTIFFNETCKQEIPVTVGATETGDVIDLIDFQNAYSVFQCTGFGEVKPLLDGTTTYQWTGANGYQESGPYAQNMCEGTYTCKADNKGCKETLTLDLCSCDVDYDDFGWPWYGSCPNTSITVKEELTFIQYGGDGAISLTVSGGNGQGNFIYNWTGPNGFKSTKKDIDHLNFGTYYLKIFDGCIEFKQTYKLEICSPDNTNHFEWIVPYCSEQEKGKIIVIASGGISAKWNDLSEISFPFINRINLDKGLYCAELKFLQNNCIVDECFEVDDNLSNDIEIVNIEPSACNYPPTGSVTFHQLIPQFNEIRSTVLKDHFGDTINSTQLISTRDVTFENIAAGNYMLESTFKCGPTKQYPIIIDNLDQSGFKIIGTQTSGTQQPDGTNGTGQINIDFVGQYNIIDLTYKWFYKNLKGDNFPAKAFSENRNISKLVSGYYKVEVSNRLTGCKYTSQFVINNNLCNTPSTSFKLFISRADIPIKFGKCSDPPVSFKIKNINGFVPIRIFHNNVLVKTITVQSEMPISSKPSTYIAIDNIPRGEHIFRIEDDCGHSEIKDIGRSCPGCFYNYDPSDQSDQFITFPGFHGGEFLIHVNCPCSSTGFFNGCLFEDTYAEVEGRVSAPLEYTFTWPNGKVCKVDRFGTSGKCSFNPDLDISNDVNIHVESNDNCVMNIPLKFGNKTNILDYKTRNGFFIEKNAKCNICNLFTGGQALVYDGPCNGEKGFEFIPNDPFAGSSSTTGPDQLAVCNSGGEFKALVFQGDDIIERKFNMPKNRALGYAPNENGNCVWGGTCVFDISEFVGIPLIDVLMPWCAYDGRDFGNPFIDDSCSTTILNMTPNPTLDRVDINYVSSEPSNATVKIFDDKTNKLKSTKEINFNYTDSYSSTISLYLKSEENLYPGIFRIEIVFDSDDCQNYIQKFIVVDGYGFNSDPEIDVSLCKKDITDLYLDPHSGHDVLVYQDVDSTGTFVTGSTYTDTTYYEIIEIFKVYTSIPNIIYVRTDFEGNVYIVGENSDRDTILIEKRSPSGIVIWNRRIDMETIYDIRMIESQNEIWLYTRSIPSGNYNIHNFAYNGGYTNSTIETITVNCPLKSSTCYYQSRISDDKILYAMNEDSVHTLMVYEPSKTITTKIDTMIRLKYAEYLYQTNEYVVGGEFDGHFVTDTTISRNPLIDSLRSIVFMWFDDEMHFIRKKVIKLPHSSVLLKSVLSDGGYNFTYTAYDGAPSADTCGFINGFTTNIPKPSLIDTISLVKTTSDDRQVINNETNIYPNPFTKSFTIDITSIEDLNSKLKVYDLFGHTVFQDELPLHKGENRYFLNQSSNWVPGVYFINLSNKNGENSYKIVKVE